MTPVANCRRYQRHRRQILLPVPLVLLTPVANFPPVSTILSANLPPVSTTPVANCHWYQRHRRQICHRCNWHRWQIIGTITGCRHLKVNLKAKIFIYVSSTTQRWPNKIIKIFLIEDFSICQTLSCEYLREFSKKFETVLMEYSGAGGKLIYKKNQKQKISWHCPFKPYFWNLACQNTWDLHLHLSDWGVLWHLPISCSLLSKKKSYRSWLI